MASVVCSVSVGGFYKPITIEDNVKQRPVPVLKHFSLFNIDQVDGVEVDPPDSVPEPERINAVEAFIASTDALIQQGGSRACYSPRSDLDPYPTNFSIR